MAGVTLGNKGLKRTSGLRTTFVTARPWVLTAFDSGVRVDQHPVFPAPPPILVLPSDTTAFVSSYPVI